jgi:chromosome segregation ATPase
MNRTGRSTTPELQELRASLDARLAALEAALDDPKQHSSLERLMLELARVATEEAEASAREVVGAVRTEGLSALEAEKALGASLRQALEDAQASLEAERSVAVAARQQLADAHQRLMDAEQRLNASSEAREQDEVERSTLRRELENALTALKTERAGAAAAEQQLASARQAREHDQAARAKFKRELENALGLLKTERGRSAGLEQALAQANAEAEAVRSAAAVGNRELAEAQSASEGERATVAHLQDTIATLERTAESTSAELKVLQQEIERMRLDAEARGSNLSGSQAELEQALGKAQQAWREARAHVDEAQAQTVLAVLERDSLKAEPERVVAAERSQQSGPPARYEELLHSSEQRIRSLELALRDAEMRAESAECELELQRRAAAPVPAAPATSTGAEPAAQGETPSFPGPARAAKRVAILGDLDIEVDGARAKLIDASVTGAQILASASMKPNRLVRLSIPNGDKAIICKGKIVWARLEPRSGQIGYRAGVSFTTADPAELEAFLGHQIPAR